MTWNPQINVFDERGAKGALKTFLLANQTDALAWANENASPVLPPVKDIFITPRMVTRFPAITFLQTSHSARMVDAILVIKFDLTIETAIQHGNQDWLATNAPKYSMAVESMLANLPETTFNENSKIETLVTIDGLDTQFDVQGKTKTGYLQIFQTRASWTIEASLIN